MIELRSDSGPVELKQWRFPAGEAGIKMVSFYPHDDCYRIKLRWESNDDLFALGQLVDALRAYSIDNIHLEIPYFPYSRQDRRCSQGEGHALKVVANFINSLKFKTVLTYDPHSYVLEGVVDNLQVMSQSSCAFRLPKYDVLIAPDAGAAKKIYTHAQVAHGTEVLIAEKERSAGGLITKMKIPYHGHLVDKRACVVDDICDGGATFIAVADAIPFKYQPNVLDLYVTHGIFTKGLDKLSIRYKTIYTANLMNPALKGLVKEI